MAAKIGAKTDETWFGLAWWCKHFLLEVDMDKAISQRVWKHLRLICVVNFVTTKIKFNNLNLSNTITIQFANNADRDTAADFLRRNGNEFTQQAVATATGATLKLNYTDARRQEIQSYA